MRQVRAFAASMAALGLFSGLSMAGPVLAAAAQPYSWASIPYGGGGFVDGFLYHPKQKNLLYARTDIGGMYRYDYENQSWIPLLDGLDRDHSENMGVLSMAVDPSDPQKLYAAVGEYTHQWAQGGAVLRSDDQGRTWQRTDLSVRLGGNDNGRGTGERLQVDPDNGQVLLLGTSQDGLWKSVDGGAHFSKTASPGDAISLVLFDPKNSQAIYAGVFNKDGTGGLYVSQGGDFVLVAGVPQLTPQHAVFGDDGALYVTFAKGDGKWAVNPNNAQDGGVWKRTPDGQWHDITPQHPGGGATFGYSGIDLDRQHPGTLVVSTLDRWGSGDDIYLSKDDGAHWSSLGGASRHDPSGYPWLINYLQGQDKMGHWLSDVRINPFNSDEMIYGTGYGLWMSENLTAAGGAQPVKFDFQVRNFEETAPLQMTSPTGGAVVLAAFGDVAGGAWDDVGKSPDAIFAPATENNYSVDYAGLNPSFVARTTDRSGNNGYYSEDGGASWTAFGASLYKRQDSKGGWHNAGIVAVSAKGTSMLWVPEKEDACWSNDKGRSWHPSAGWPAGRDIQLVPVSDKAVDGVYYVYDRVANAVLISTDGGANFQPIMPNLPKIEGWQKMQLAVVPGRMRDLWIAAPYGLVHSPSADAPAKNVPDVDEAWQVGFGKAATDGGYPAVFLWGRVKGQEGLWRSDDEGRSWVRINDDAHRFGWIAGISGDLLDAGTVYIAVPGRGIMVGKKPQADQ